MLRAFAALFKQARQQRITDKGKEKSGTQPAPHYGPRGMRASVSDAQATDLLTSRRTAGSAEGASSEGAKGDIIIVRPLRAQVNE